MATPAAKAVGRDIGLDVPVPPRACEDRHCPFHGHLSVRGNVFDGEVLKTSMQKTIIVQRELTRKEPKFERLLRVSRKYAVHSPPCLAIKVGDLVRIAECRPISKTVAFVAVAVNVRAQAPAPLTLPTAKPEEIPVELGARPIRMKRFRDKPVEAPAKPSKKA
jgi:small subunit ribosomal protein S17